MFEVDKLSSFSPNCQKITWGHHGGVSDTPMIPPMLFISKNKNYLSNQMHSFLPRTKITWGASCAPHDTPHHRGIRHYPSFVHHPQHPSPAHHTHHHTPTPPPPTHPQRKSGALMPDISWAPLHSLSIR